MTTSERTSRNPCNLGIWAKYEGVLDLCGDMYIYRRRRWAYLWPWYWKFLLSSYPIESAIYTIKRHWEYHEWKLGAKVGYSFLKIFIRSSSKYLSIPVEKHMPDGVNTMYNCVRDNPEEWTVDRYTGMPMRRNQSDV